MFGRSAPQVLVVQVPLDLGPLAVRRALRARENATEAYVSALEAFRRAERVHDAAVATAYTTETGPAHQLKHLTELATVAEREARDAAELVYRKAEQDLKQASYGFWAAMGGAAAPEAGES